MVDLELDFVGGGGEDVDVDVDEEGFEREEGHDVPMGGVGRSGGGEEGGRRDGKEGRRVGMRVGAGRWVEAEEEGVGRVREARVRSLIEEEEGGEGGVYD